MRIIVCLLAYAGLISGAQAQVPALDIPFTVTRPAGAGPFPAVVLMHDCSGLGPNSSGAPWRWSSELTRLGYATIWPDSFSTRGHLAGVCREPNRANVAPRARVADALAALAHLRTLPFVDPTRIAIMGGSHGGTSTLAAVDSSRKVTSETTFVAAIALYPACRYLVVDPGDRTRDRIFAPHAPTLILVGDLDDWTPAAPCERMVAASKQANMPIDLEIYKGAHHSFDSSAPVRFDPTRINASAPTGRGATVGGNREAWDKAKDAVRGFLSQHLAKSSP